MLSSRVARLFFGLAAGAAVWACPFSQELREYLKLRFWLPFTKRPVHFAKGSGVTEVKPFAGMAAADGGTPLDVLRQDYKSIAEPVKGVDLEAMRARIAAARAMPSLTPREREEIDLIDAKTDMRAGQPDRREHWHESKRKLQTFLRTARTPEYRSEARGWLARVHYLLGEQAAAGKIYLDELNRTDSNLSRETLLDSLSLTYGYDGGSELIQHIDEYFDTAEHAAFAIQLVTNPRSDWNRYPYEPEKDLEPSARTPPPYRRIVSLLETHRGLLSTLQGSNALAILAMRTALRAGDLPAVIRLAAAVPARSPVRSEPDFLWMLGSANFLSRRYAAAEAPLLQLWKSSRAQPTARAAAAYGLCGVYQKTGNVVEQIRFALWLHSEGGKNAPWEQWEIDGRSVYYASSGWDLAHLLDFEASIDSIRAFLERHPKAAGTDLVRYSLAVRLAREERYAEAAALYDAASAPHRSARMRKLDALHRQPSSPEARYSIAEYLAANSDRIYFNDRLWYGFQRHALSGDTESRLTRAERDRLLAAERKLKDGQGRALARPPAAARRGSPGGPHAARDPVRPPCRYLRPPHQRPLRPG